MSKQAGHDLRHASNEGQRGSLASRVHADAGGRVRRDAVSWNEPAPRIALSIAVLIAIGVVALLVLAAL